MLIGNFVGRGLGPGFAFIGAAGPHHVAARLGRDGGVGFAPVRHEVSAGDSGEHHTRHRHPFRFEPFESGSGRSAVRHAGLEHQDDGVDDRSERDPVVGRGDGTVVENDAVSTACDVREQLKRLGRSEHLVGPFPGLTTGQEPHLTLDADLLNGVDVARGVGEDVAEAGPIGCIEVSVQCRVAKIELDRDRDLAGASTAGGESGRQPGGRVAAVGGREEHGDRSRLDFTKPEPERVVAVADGTLPGGSGLGRDRKRDQERTREPFVLDICGDEEGGGEAAAQAGEHHSPAEAGDPTEKDGEEVVGEDQGDQRAYERGEQQEQPRCPQRCCHGVDSPRLLAQRGAFRSYRSCYDRRRPTIRGGASRRQSRVGPAFHWHDGAWPLYLGSETEGLGTRQYSNAMHDTAGEHVALEAQMETDFDALAGQGPLEAVRTEEPSSDEAQVVDAGSGIELVLDDDITCGYGSIENLVAAELELTPDAAAPGRAYRFAKRALDLLVGVPSLILAAPVMLIIALVLRLDSPGPAIFRQDRVGHGGRFIRFYKFRTMYVDAAERFPELYEYSYTAEQLEHTYYKGGVDPRNTRVGTWLRKTTLDELPNLINVVRGNVSLVGPRPELKEMVRYYSPRELSKFTVKSGITGLAQCSGRNNLTVRQQIAADVEYVETQSMWTDIKILFRTAWSVIRSEGAI